MVTTFNITCSNWQDPNLPIKYEYAYVVNGVRSVFLIHTAESPGQTVISSSELPIGDPNRNNVLDIYVNIKDKFGSATEQNFTVKVVTIRFSQHIVKNLKFSLNLNLLILCCV